MAWIRVIDRWVMKFERWVLSLSIWGIFFVVVGNVFSRWLFRYSWKATEEVGQFLVVALTFIGISYGVRWNRHIQMSALYDALPRVAQRILTVIISAVTAVTYFYLAYLGIKYVQQVEALGRVSPALQVPMYLVMIPIPVGFALGGIQYVRAMFGALTGAEPEAEPTPAATEGAAEDAPKEAEAPWS